MEKSSYAFKTGIIGDAEKEVTRKNWSEEEILYSILGTLSLRP